MKNLYKIFTSQVGMSLVELVVVGALAGAAALGVASMMGNMGGGMKKTEAMMAKAEFASALGVYLYSGIGCEDLRTASTRPDDTYTDEDIPLQLTKWRYQGRSPIEAGVDLKHFQLESLEAKLNIYPTMPKVTMTFQQAPPASPATYTREFTDTLLMVTAKLRMGDRIYRHSVNLPVFITESGSGAYKVEFCGKEKGLDATCTALDGTYVPPSAGEDGGICQLKKSCITQGSYIALKCGAAATAVPGGSCSVTNSPPRALPSPRPNPITNTYACPPGTTPVTTGGESWTHTIGCGKKCSYDIQHSLGFYTCLKCPES